jgi:DNA-binding NtrC family response regulator
VSEDVARLSFKEAKDKMTSLFHNQYIMALLRESGGNISKAAEIAGIQRQYLHRLMKEAGIEADQFKQKPE